MAIAKELQVVPHASHLELLCGLAAANFWTVPSILLVSLAGSSCFAPSCAHNPLAPVDPLDGSAFYDLPHGTRIYPSVRDQ